MLTSRTVLWLWYYLQTRFSKTLIQSRTPLLTNLRRTNCLLRNSSGWLSRTNNRSVHTTCTRNGDAVRHRCSCTFSLRGGSSSGNRIRRIRPVIHIPLSPICKRILARQKITRRSICCMESMRTISRASRQPTSTHPRLFFPFCRSNIPRIITKWIFLETQTLFRTSTDEISFVKGGERERGSFADGGDGCP